ncbi:hypothetical protein [Leclercia sp.]|uniref:hypothetical protein n=1 Tax=Leclercia sp. TaxID=1898428 RepID=UPI002FDDC753
MKNNLLIAAVMATIFAGSVAPAHAISEAYRKQLQREHKTQQDDVNGDHTAPTKGPGAGLHTYADNIIEVQADSRCNVKKVNGFAPAGTKLVKGTNIMNVKTKMGATISVEKRSDGSCDMTWTNDEGQSGILKQQ